MLLYKSDYLSVNYLEVQYLIHFKFKESAQNIDESLLSSESESIYESELIEKLSAYRRNPLNLNKITRKQLQLFPCLSSIDIEKILSYQKNNSFKKLSELKNTGLSENKISEILPYLSITETNEASYKNTVRQEIIKSKADSPYPLRYLQKTKIKYNNFNFGFISQKDEGEKNLLDFYSYYADYKTSKYHIIIGKYRIYLGQGILFAPKLGMSKSSSATYGAFKQTDTIRPYTSSYEIWELQGPAIEYMTKNFHFTSFASRNFLSASLTDNKITSFNETGLHLDLEKKDNVDETIFGSALAYKNDFSKLEVYVISQRFNLEFANNNLDNNYLAFGTDFYIMTDGYPLFGEIATTNEKIAFIIGKKWGEKTIQQQLIFRNYPNKVPAWHGKPFSAQNSFDNETGLYYGITYNPINNLKINTYLDLWKHPQPRYLEKMATSCNDFLLHINYKHQNNYFVLHLQNKNKESQNSGEIKDFRRTTYRIDWKNKQNNFNLKHRIEYSCEYFPTEKAFEKGYLSYIQLEYKHKVLQFIGRIAVFRSDVLLYMYENNVSGIMQTNILSGDGVNGFAVIKYKLSSKFELQAKISNSFPKPNNLKIYLQLITEL